MKLSVALDLEKDIDNLNLVKQLKGFPIWIKIGLRTYIRDGRNIIDEVKNIDQNLKIFLDLKLYDIPNTMGDASESIADLGIDMFNVHASAGEKAMQEVMKRLNSRKNRPIVLAVTALTSFEENEFYKIYNQNILDKSLAFAEMSYRAGIDGVVSSVFESKNIKEKTSSNFITLTPGIRPFGENRDDQNRIGTIEIAKNNLADFIVVGRPIYQSNDPRGVVEKILIEISK